MCIRDRADSAPWEEGKTSEAPEGSVLALQDEWEQMREDNEEEENADELDKHDS